MTKNLLRQFRRGVRVSEPTQHVTNNLRMVGGVQGGEPAFAALSQHGHGLS
jgi:hypothetical protein